MRPLVVALSIVLTACAADSSTSDDDFQEAPRCDPGTELSGLEPCGPVVDGWEGWCEDGLVYVRSIGGVTYCKAGTDEPVCSTIGADQGSPRYRCQTQCMSGLGSTRSIAETQDDIPRFVLFLCEGSAADPL